MDAPVLLLVFNRPDCTARTLAAIRQARPKKLFVVADSPRADRPDEAEKCRAVRDLIENGVDWPCEVERNYAEENMGCALRVSSGITWAFSRAEKLIILEDDILPDASFFPFCDELLIKYADDRRIAQINGCTRFFSDFETDTSYVFSRWAPIWGWASWRRAWSAYDLRMASWPAFRDSGGMKRATRSPAEFTLRTKLFEDLYQAPHPHTWDYQWSYSVMSRGLLAAMPRVNLIENIGFTPEGTHYAPGSSFGLVTHSLPFPLVHPRKVALDPAFEKKFSAAWVHAVSGGQLQLAPSRMERLVSGLRALGLGRRRLS
jgi:hypothetical protein